MNQFFFSDVVQIESMDAFDSCFFLKCVNFRRRFIHACLIISSVTFISSNISSILTLSVLLFKLQLLMIRKMFDEDDYLYA